MRTRYYEDVAAGQALPSLDFEVSMTALVLYAGATWDFHRYHYDAPYVNAHGIRAPFLDGQLLGALMARQLMDWGGPDAFVRRLSYRLRGMVFVGERVVLTGRVTGTAVEDGRALALCSLDIAKGDGAEVLRDATAAIELPRR